MIPDTSKMTQMATLEERILQILGKNNISKRYFWNDDILCERLPDNDYDLYWSIRNKYDEHINDEFRDDTRLLNKYNDFLSILGYEKQTTLAGVRKIFKKKVFISIRDFLAGNYERRKENLSEFRRYLSKNRSMIYPLERAKSENLKLFLKNVFDR